MPNKVNERGEQQTVEPADIRAMAAYCAERRTATTPFDIIMEGRTPGDDPAAQAAKIGPYIAAGITWWLETMWSAPNDPATARARIRHGPPRL